MTIILPFNEPSFNHSLANSSIIVTSPLVTPICRHYQPNHFLFIIVTMIKKLHDPCPWGLNNTQSEVLRGCKSRHLIRLIP